MKNYKTKSFTLEVEVKSAIPIYEQVKNSVKLAVFVGTLSQGDKIISIRELSTRHNINPLTVMKAYNQLENEGYLFSRKGSGYFVKFDPGEINKQRLKQLAVELRKFIQKIAELGFSADDLKAELEKFIKEHKND